MAKPPEAAGSQSAISPSTVVAAVVLLSVAVVLRFLPAATHDWPYRDGGLFFAMIGDLLDHGFSLPLTTSYQDGVIPYAYPPLAFYIGAGFEAATGLARSDLLRLLPALMSVMCVAAMYLVARVAAPMPRYALLAATFYVAVASLTDVLIAGGGLTRGLGLLFALLATWQGLLMYETGRPRHVAGTAIFAGLAILSHPEAGVFITISLGSALLFHRHVRPLLQSIIAALGALLIASPWLITVVARHGLAPFAAALLVPRRDLFDSGIAYVFLFLLAIPVIGILDLVGQFRQVKRRQPQLVVWRAGVFTFDLRYSPVAGGPPVSILAAVGALDVLEPIADRALHGIQSRGRLRSVGQTAVRRIVIGSVVALAFVPAIVASAGFTRAEGAITMGDREAMAWIRENSEPTTRVAVLATDAWGSDLVSEWAPALTERVSLTTSQGFEWAAPAIRAEQGRRESDLRACYPADAACLDAWLTRERDGDDVEIYVTRSADPRTVAACCAAMLRAMVDSGKFGIIWEGAGGVILAPSRGSAAE